VVVLAELIPDCCPKVPGKSDKLKRSNNFLFRSVPKVNKNENGSRALNIYVSPATALSSSCYPKATTDSAS
jgi:hypothetical protein